MLLAALLPCGNQAFGKILSSFNDQALSSLRRRTHKRRNFQVFRYVEAGQIDQPGDEGPPHRLRFRGNGLQVPPTECLRVRCQHHHRIALLCRPSCAKTAVPKMILTRQVAPEKTAPNIPTGLARNGDRACQFPLSLGPVWCRWEFIVALTGMVEAVHFLKITDLNLEIPLGGVQRFMA